MRRISRATTKNDRNIRFVFVDLLEQKMMDIKALRKKVADAERRAALKPEVHHRLKLPLAH